MSTAGANERRTVFYSGRVQGVGFRYTARVAAGGYDVTGLVQNLDDGRVRLVVEGSKTEIEGLLADIAERMRGYIRNTEMTTSPATGEFTSFGIEH